LSTAAQHLDADEVLDAHCLPLAQVDGMIASGELQDAKSICALLLAQKWLERHFGQALRKDFA